MANEITTTSYLVITKGGAHATSFPNVKEFKEDMAGTETFQATQIIGTTAELIILGDITSAGQLGKFEIRNTDPTNFVDISYGDATSTNFADKIITQIPPGKSSGAIRCHPSRNALYAKADTAACQIMTVAGQA